MASVIAETRLQATDDFRFEAPPGNGRFLSQPTMKLLRQPQTDHPMSRPPLHQGKASIDELTQELVELRLLDYCKSALDRRAKQTQAE